MLFSCLNGLCFETLRCVVCFTLGCPEQDLLVGETLQGPETHACVESILCHAISSRDVVTFHVDSHTQHVRLCGRAGTTTALGTSKCAASTGGRTCALVSTAIVQELRNLMARIQGKFVAPLAAISSGYELAGRPH